MKASSPAQSRHCRNANAGQPVTQNNCAWCRAEYAAEIRTLKPWTHRFQRLRAEILRLNNPNLSHGICKRHLAMELAKCTHHISRSKAKRLLHKPHVTKRARRSRTSHRPRKTTGGV